MNGLRLRIILLSGMVALVAVLACILAVDLVTRRHRRAEEDRRITEEIHCFKRQFDNLLAHLRYEVADYANWDELWNRAPQPDAAWAKVNLAPGISPGGLTQVMVLGTEGRVLGRFRSDSQRGAEPDLRDPAPATWLLPLFTPQPTSGLAILNGYPALFASAPIRHSDRSGPAKGHLLMLAYLTPELLRHLDSHGYSCQTQARSTSPGAAPSALTFGPSIITRTPDLTVDFTLQVQDGTLLFRLKPFHAEVEVDRSRIAIAGLVVALGAAGLGVVLGWIWLRPVLDLAAACRRSPDGGTHRLPTGSGLPEADLLATEFNRRLADERSARDHLTETAARETTVHAVQRRFLGQLGHELGQPLRHLIALTDQMVTHTGPNHPERLAALRLCASTLEERFQEVIGLAPETTEPRGLGGRQDLRQYAMGLLDQMRPLAQRKNLELFAAVPERETFIPGRLLTPILVNLLSNAIRATDSGTITLTCSVDAEQMCWAVKDTGRGMAVDLAERIARACVHGEVMSGDKGLGLGLTLALANVRALQGRMELCASGPPETIFRVRFPLMDGGS